MLKIEQVSKYFGGVKAIHRVNIEARQALITGLIGPNGAGKTTLFNCITGIIPPTEGSIVFKGRPIETLPAHRINRMGIARTFQNIRIFREMTVLENVMTGAHARLQCGLGAAVFHSPKMRREQAEVTAHAIDLLEQVNLTPVRNQYAQNLPYGDQRRLEIARALASCPELLLLDEPAAGMNPTETSLLMNLIRSIRDRGITILLIEHDMKLVMSICDSIVVLDHGETIAEGTPGEIRRDQRVIEAYLGIRHDEVMHA